MTLQRNRLFFCAALAALALPALVFPAAARAHPAPERPLYKTYRITSSDSEARKASQQPTLWNKLPHKEKPVAEEKAAPQAEAVKTEAETQAKAEGPAPAQEPDAGPAPETDPKTASQPTPSSPFADLLQRALGKKEDQGMQRILVTPPEK